MKRIMLVHRPGGAFGYITDSWANTLRSAGHKVQRWDGLIESWKVFSPDLYIGSSGHRQPVPKDPSCKFAMHVNPYGPMDCGAINESADSIQYIRDMNPSLVFGYGFEEDRVYWQYWKEKLGIPWCPMPTGADATIFKRTAPPEHRALAAAYIGGRWAYKAKSIDAYLIPMIRHVAPYNYKVEIHGWGEWQDGLSHGILPEDKVIPTFNRAQIGPCISEPHTQKWGFDLPERVWKVAACGCLPIHDPVPTLHQLLPDLPMARNPEEYAGIHLHYMVKTDERIELADRIHKQVMNNHTYHHRLATLFNALGWHKEATDLVANVPSN